MNTQLLINKVFFWTSFIVLFIQTRNEAFASHAQSADITYQCLGGNQYQVSLSFYRDCAGVAAPTTANINIFSASCGQNFTATLNPIAGTGNEVSPICSQFSTQCSGGTYPGVQEYIYRGIVTLPSPCTDWVFSFTLCCRNASISTILNPSSESIYVEAHLNNLNFPCNNSPTFSNAPVPFVCVGQPYCFNNGSSDVDGDSLSYILITPETSASTAVTYLSPYSASQPLASSPAVTFNNATGDMCMTPSQLQVTVFAVLVEEWRNGVLVGSVMRDIQLRTITCTNSNPYVNGINNTGQYTLTSCAGTPINFNISSYDADASQNVTIVWNSGITGGSFTTSGGARPTASFSWTPTVADISTAPYCFTITVKDDNCPYNGSQTYSFCITVTGVALTTTSTPANCNASNGTASVQIVSGASPFTYQWLPNGGNNANANGLQPGTYTVNITDASGCVGSSTAVVGTGSAPGTINVNITNVSCYGGNNGSVSANVNGGQQPYTYQWSNGDTTATINNVTSGAYSLTITTANGCTASTSAIITQPSSPVSYSLSQTNVTCNGLTDGATSVLVAGGTMPYSYYWNTTPIQTTASAGNLGAGVYSVIISDYNGCSTSASVTITQPPALIVNTGVVNNVTCYGFNNGSASVSVSGGTGSYNYLWNTNPTQYTSSINNVGGGNYAVTVKDANNCSATASVVIVEPSALTLISSFSPVTCNGACNGQISVTPSGGTGTYNYQWMPTGGTAATALSLCPSIYTVNITDANGCTINTSATITQPSALTFTLTQTNVTCNGLNNGTAAITMSGGAAPYTYLWNTNQATSSITNLSAGNYSVNIMDNNGCSVTASITITQPPALIVNTGVINNVTCYGFNNGSASVSVSGGTGSYNYVWNTTPAQYTSSISNVGGGNYSVTVKDANNCSATASVIITEPSALTQASSFSPVTCNGACNGQIAVTVAGGTGNYNYQWMPTGGTTATASGLCPSTYIAHVTDANGCVINSSTTITEPPALSLTLSQTNVTCNGSTNGMAAITMNGGTAPYMYLWNTNQTTSSITNLSAGNYSVTVTDNNGCSATANVIITQPQALTANAMVVANVTCYGLANGSATVGATGGTGSYSYMWNTNPIQYSQSINGLAPGNYTATITDANNCITTSGITITQPQPLTLNAAGFPVVCNGACNGQTAVIPSGGTASYTYQWLPNGGTGASSSGLCPGIYSITVTDANSCVATANVNVTQPSAVVTTATGNTTMCYGQSTTISANGSGGNGGYNYNWSGGLSSSGTQTVSPAIPTIYTVVAVDVAGCLGNQATVSVNVTSLTAENVTVSGATSICYGASVSISSAVIGNTGPVNINWNNGLGAGNGPFTVSPATSTNYIVTVTDGCNNLVNATVPITVNPLPVITIGLPSTTGCSEAVVNFYDSSTTNAGAQYLWNFDDGTTSNKTNPTHSYSVSGNYNINVLVTSVYGCSNTATAVCSIIVNPGTKAKFTAEALDGTTISPVYKFTSSSVNAASHLWSFGDGSGSSQVNPMHTYAAKGEYLVKLVTTTTAGCKDSVSIPVEIKPEFTLYIPNTFTPDGNGTNDYFTAKGQEIIEFDMMIFDRWGELIYQTDNMDKGWDGRANNGSGIAQTGVYVYKIQVRDFEHRYHDYVGHVTLLKQE